MPNSEPAFQAYWCYGHERVEVMAHEAYIWCFECKHVFATEQELIDANYELIRSMWLWDRENFDDEWWTLGFRFEARGDQIHICPVCMHDF